jgi:calcium-dependent protein kinase
MLEMLMNEFSILKTADHPNIVKIFEMYEDVSAYYIVTELLAGGELLDSILHSVDFDEKLLCNSIK